MSRNLHYFVSCLIEGTQTALKWLREGTQHWSDWVKEFSIEVTGWRNSDSIEVTAWRNSALKWLGEGTQTALKWLGVSSKNRVRLPTGVPLCPAHVWRPPRFLSNEHWGRGLFEEKRLEHKADYFLNLVLWSIMHGVLPPRQSYTFHGLVKFFSPWFMWRYWSLWVSWVVSWKRFVGLFKSLLELWKAGREESEFGPVKVRFLTECLTFHYVSHFVWLTTGYCTVLLPR
jgi:hypothetical protein